MPRARAPYRCPAGQGLRQVRAEGIALIGDPRNDSHLFVSQLHLAMLRLHNLAVDHLRGKGVPEGSIFDEARRILSWTYQCPRRPRSRSLTCSSRWTPDRGLMRRPRALMRTLTAAPARP